jgi:uncharacterized integral membrane protein
MTMASVTYQGVYGPFTVTAAHRREVLLYRLSLLLLAVAQIAALAQWRWIGPDLCWPWVLLMLAGLVAGVRWLCGGGLAERARWGAA